MREASNLYVLPYEVSISYDLFSQCETSNQYISLGEALNPFFHISLFKTSNL